MALLRGGALPYLVADPGSRIRETFELVTRPSIEHLGRLNSGLEVVPDDGEQVPRRWDKAVQPASPEPR